MMRVSLLTLCTVATMTGVTEMALADTLAVDASPDYSSPAASPTPPPATGEGVAVMATDIQVAGAQGELAQIVLDNINTRLGQATSEMLLQQDIRAILKTGLFNDVEAYYKESPGGWDVVYQVQPVRVRSLQLENAQVLSPEVARELFQPQLGETVSPSTINASIEKVNQWYKDNGYALAQVADVRVVGDGVLNVNVAEGVIRSINIRYFDEQGQPTEGRTDESFVQEQLNLQPGEVFQVDTAQEDLQNLYRLGLFNSANITLDGDTRALDVTYQLSEAAVRGVDAGGGYSEANGLFGTVSYNDRNVGGIGQNLGLSVQVSRSDLQFEGNFGSPYRPSNPDTPGYNLNAFRNRGVSTNFDDDVRLENGDRPREGRFGGGVSFQKPVEDWNTSLGVNYNRVSIRDADGNLTPEDQYGNPLSFSENGIDDLVTVQARVSQDNRNNPLNPTSGSVVSFSSEQSLPIGEGNIFNNRLNASYSNYTPTRVFDSENPEVLAFNVQAGTAIGDLPPYQAFTLGGTNSVRGYDTAELGNSRSYFLASAEYRIPLFESPVSGVVFADFGSDLGSGTTTVGEGGVIETDKGTGFGYGAGLRVNSPVGILRADFGLNDQGNSRFHFGVGHRF
ncbi:BamA/TamA family outer membrane protein [Spirulina sp. CS-785/01]|uniref:BamA/TamA family outer membrane protein n=1 Tax=Spirulina sp. CS-785/01 TaxID=3021716 RepID=UPI00232B59AC|nr:BamA/TamA family outer membrane protein [Spirulina sp. CS-785/01]MDB9311684.1 BamA/TamA family outer membrane protein [Spirulina sp. CS-785/01]